MATPGVVAYRRNASPVAVVIPGRLGVAGRWRIRDDETVVTLATVLLLGAGLGAACAFVLRRRMAGSHRWARRTVVALTGVAVFVVAVDGWAHLMIDRSAIARALVWRGAAPGDPPPFP